MSTEEKLEFLLSSLLMIAMGTTDDVTVTYCAIILEEVGEADRVKELFNASAKSDPTLA